MNDTSTNPTTPGTPPPPPPAAMPAPPVAYAAPYARPVKSTAVAGILSAIIPGLGHAYLGLISTAAIYFGVWILAWAIGGHHHGTAAWLVVPFWWFFVMIDAIRKSQAINAASMPEATPPADILPLRQIGTLGVGVFFVLVGLFFLLNRFVSIDLEALLDWWPLLLILFGAWQIYSHLKAKEKPKEEEPTPL